MKWWRAWSGRGRRGNRQTKQSRARAECLHTHTHTYEERRARSDANTLFRIVRSVTACFLCTWLSFVLVSRFGQTKPWQFVRSCTWRASLCHFLGGSEALRCPLISHRSLARISTSIRPSPSTPKVTHFLLTFPARYSYCIYAAPCTRRLCSKT